MMWFDERAGNDFDFKTWPNWLPTLVLVIPSIVDGFDPELFKLRRRWIKNTVKALYGTVEEFFKTNTTKYLITFPSTEQPTVAIYYWFLISFWNLIFFYS